jgi:hypothetical protein
LNGLALGDDFSRNSNRPEVDRGQNDPGWQEIHCRVTPKHLTSFEAGIEYREIRANGSLRVFSEGDASRFMTSKPFSHPQNADAEFVECLECREVFESSELKDMSIEESTEGEAQES